MDFSKPPGASQDDLLGAGADEAPVRRQLDPRILRSVVAGAAAVAVLGGTAGAFLWLSSAPSGDSAQALSVAAPKNSASAEATVNGAQPIVLSGGNVFAAAAGSGSGSGTDAGTTTGGSASTGTTGGASALPTPAGTTASTSSPKPTSVPVTTAAHTPAPAGSSTPTPSRSTAPAWVPAEVRFTAGDATSATFDLGGLTAEGSNPEEQRGVVVVGYGQLVGPLSVRYYGVTSSGSAILLSDADRGTGWLVPAKTVLPDAVVGVTKGRVRVYGVASSADDGTTFWVRVDRQERIAVKTGAAVDGTGLTLVGAADDAFATIDPTLRASMGNTDPVAFMNGSVTYFGRFGGGETDGVAF